MARMAGVIFSDLGLASSFMSLDWVQAALERSLGFAPFPATLNLRPKAEEDRETWRRVRQTAGLPVAAAEEGFCSARLYRIEVIAGSDGGERRIAGAVLVPEVKDYPAEKIEVVAPLRLKDHLNLRDGDAVTLEFLN